MLTLRIPKDLHKKVKHLATDRETSLQAVVVAALRELVEREEKREPSEPVE